jgi:fatty acid desaturase
MSVLKVRIFLEHRAHEEAPGRTVVVERGGILGFLFLYNNLHIVHHSRPRLPWYRLPALYAAEREAFLERNRGYSYGSYGEIFRRYFLSAKDPVPHPLRPLD